MAVLGGSLTRPGDLAYNGFVQDFLANWQKGVEQFNAQRYWEAHEAWEQVWRKLSSKDPPIEKTHIQILIQAAGVFYLMEKGRIRGAIALAQTALEKIQWLREQGGVESSYPRVEVPGVEVVLQDFVRTGLLSPKNRLTARLLVSPV